MDPAISSAAASLYWAEVSAIAAGMAAIGTFLAPLFALQVSAWLQRRQEKRRQRFDLYQTLLQWRATPFLELPVRAFNSIDTVFNDVRAVRDAWSDLFSAYNDQRLNTPEGARIRQDRLTTLLQVMAHNLGYERHFTKADLERIYNPEPLSRYYSIWLEQQRQTYETMFSQKPPSPPPPNQEDGPKS